MPKNKKHRFSKALHNIQETLNDIDVKLDELRELDKGSKFFVIAGYLLMGLGGGGLFTVMMWFRDKTALLDILFEFITASVLIVTMIGGFMLAHKGLTGDWL